MELWIRSQDKERFIKVNNIFIHQDNNHLICANQRAIDQFNDESFELGAYSSRKRALEVLDEIQKLIKPTFKINYEYDDSQPIIDGEWLKSLKAESKIEELSCYVYEMPKR